MVELSFVVNIGSNIVVSCVRIPSNCLSEVNGVVGVWDGMIGNGVGGESIGLFSKLIRENSSIGHVKIFERRSFDNDKCIIFNEWKHRGRSLTSRV